LIGTSESQAFILGKQALKRIGRADEVADVVDFLAGPKSGWVTGQSIEVSGGTALTL
jgi:NAD(P)-dependent dehydrogenase (short-subunit alcohol dehydrogenase family)